MQEGSNRLRGVLQSLVSEGALSAEQSDLVTSRFLALDSSQSRKSIFAEIAAYLGGAFILIATILLAGDYWQDAPRYIRVGSLGILSILLAITAISLGNLSAMRLRLASVLFMGSAIAATGSIALTTEMDGAPWAPFSIGAAIALSAFIKYKHEILHIGAYGYLFIAGLMILGEITRNEPEVDSVYAIYWAILATIWLYLSWSKMVDQTLGYLISAATLFLSTQFLFLSDHRPISYFVAVIAVPSLAWIYLQDRRWPLLLGAVAITTFTMGEFVGATLGGSLGALLGLMAAGLTLITTSIVAIRKAQQL